ncbi:hypothetical protein WA158_003977 [Blastocystis sp. Blastoise]
MVTIFGFLYDGMTKENVGFSCYTIMRSFPNSKNGKYWINFYEKTEPHMVYCDFTHDEGGWTAFYINNNFNTTFPRYSYSDLFTANKIMSIDKYKEHDVNITAFVPPSLLSPISWMVRDIYNWNDTEFTSLHFTSPQVMEYLIDPNNLEEKQLFTIPTGSFSYTSSITKTIASLHSVQTHEGFGFDHVPAIPTELQENDSTPGIERFPTHFLGHVHSNEDLFRARGCGGFVSGINSVVCIHSMREDRSSLSIHPLIEALLHEGNIVCTNSITLYITFKELVSRINREMIIISPDGEVKEIKRVDHYRFTVTINIPKESKYTIYLDTGAGIIRDGFVTPKSNILQFTKDSSSFCIDISVDTKRNHYHNAIYTNANPIIFYFSPSLPLSRLPESSISIINGQIISITQLHDSFECSIKPIEQGEVTVYILSNIIETNEGQHNLGTYIYSVEYDNEQPIVFIQSDLYHDRSYSLSFSLTIQFSEEVEDFDQHSFIPTGLIVNSLYEENDHIYRLNMTFRDPHDYVPATLQILPGIIHDRAENFLTKRYHYDCRYSSLVLYYPLQNSRHDYSDYEKRCKGNRFIQYIVDNEGLKGGSLESLAPMYRCYYHPSWQWNTILPDMTISFWYKQLKLTNKYIFLSFASSTDHHYSIEIYDSSLLFLTGIFPEDVSKNSNNCQAYFFPLPSLSIWHHISMTLSIDKKINQVLKTIYIDGLMKNQCTYSYQSQDPRGNMIIGKNFISGQNMLISHIKIWKRLLIPQEIYREFLSNSPFMGYIEGPRYINSFPVSVKIHFTRDVTEIKETDLFVDSCYVTKISKNNEAFTFTVQLDNCENHDITVTVLSSNIVYKGIPLREMNRLQIKYDTNPPYALFKVPVVIPTYISTISIHILWSEGVYFLSSDIHLTNCILLSFETIEDHEYNIIIHVQEPGEFIVEIKQGIKDFANNISMEPFSYIGIYQPYDNIITYYSPSQMNTHVLPNTTITLRFLDTVEQNRGYVVLFPFNCMFNSQIMVLRTPSTRIQIEDNKVNILPEIPLYPGCSYRLEISKNAFSNFNGLWRGYYWFSIESTIQYITIENTIPIFNAQNVQVNSIIYIKFSTPITYCTENMHITNDYISIYSSNNHILPLTFDVQSPLMTLRHSELSILPSTPLYYDTTYIVNIPNQFICDNNNHPFEGLKNQFTFTTQHDIYPPKVILTTYHEIVGRTPIIVNVKFNEPIVDFSKDKINIDYGTIIDIYTSDQQEFKVVIMPIIKEFGESFDITLYIPSHSVTDRNGNYNEASNHLSIYYRPIVGRWLHKQFDDESDYKNKCDYMNIKYNTKLLSPNGKTNFVHHFINKNNTNLLPIEKYIWKCGYNREYNIGSHPYSQLSISFWFKLEFENITSLNAKKYLVYKGCNGDEETFEYNIHIQFPNQLCFVTGGSDSCNSLCISINTLENWHYIVATIDLLGTNKGEKVLYIDGHKENNCFFESKNPSIQSCPLYIGDRSILLHDIGVYRQLFTLNTVQLYYKESGIMYPSIRFKDMEGSENTISQDTFSIYVNWYQDIDSSIITNTLINIYNIEKQQNDTKLNSLTKKYFSSLVLNRYCSVISIDKINSSFYQYNYKINEPSNSPYLFFIPAISNSQSTLSFASSNVLSLLYNPIQPIFQFYVNSTLPSSSPSVYITITSNSNCILQEQNIHFNSLSLLHIYNRNQYSLLHVQLLSNTKLSTIPSIVIPAGICHNGPYSNIEYTYSIPFLNSFSNMYLLENNHGKSSILYNQNIPSDSNYELSMEVQGDDFFINIYDTEDIQQSKYFSLHYLYELYQFSFDLNRDQTLIKHIIHNITDNIDIYQQSISHYIQLKRNDNILTINFIHDGKEILLFEYIYYQIPINKYITFANNINPIYISHLSIYPQASISPEIFCNDMNNHIFSSPSLTISCHFSKDIFIYDPTKVIVYNGFIHSWSIEENTFELTPLLPSSHSDYRNNTNIILNTLYIDNKDIEDIKESLNITIIFPNTFAQDREQNSLISKEYHYIFDPSRPTVQLTYSSSTTFAQSSSIPFIITATFSKSMQLPLASSLLIFQGHDISINKLILMENKKRYGYISNIHQIDDEGKVFTFDVYPYMQMVSILIGEGSCQDIIGNTNTISNILNLSINHVTSLILKTNDIYTLKHEHMKVNTNSKRQFLVRLTGKQAEIYFCENDYRDICVIVRIVQSTIYVSSYHEGTLLYITSLSFPLQLLHPLLSRLFTFSFESRQLEVFIENKIIQNMSGKVNIPKGFPSLSYIYFATHQSPLIVNDLRISYEMESPPTFNINIRNSLPITSYPIYITLLCSEHTTSINLNQLIIKNGIATNLETNGIKTTFLIYPNPLLNSKYHSITLIIPSDAVKSPSTGLSNSEIYKEFPISSIIHSYIPAKSLRDIGWREGWKGMKLKDIEFKYKVKVKKDSSYSILLSPTLSISDIYLELLFCERHTFEILLHNNTSISKNTQIHNSMNVPSTSLYINEKVPCPVEKEQSYWIKILDDYLYVGTGEVIGLNMLIKYHFLISIPLLYYSFTSDYLIEFKDIYNGKKEGIYIYEQYDKPNPYYNSFIEKYPIQKHSLSNREEEEEEIKLYREFTIHKVENNLYYNSYSTLLPINISSIIFEVTCTPHMTDYEHKYMIGQSFSNSNDKNEMPFFFGLVSILNINQYNIVIMINNRIIHISPTTITDNNLIGLRIYRDSFNSIYCYYNIDILQDEDNWVYVYTIQLDDWSDSAVFSHLSSENQLLKVHSMKLFEKKNDLSYIGCYSMRNVINHIYRTSYLSNEYCRGKCYNEGYLFAGINKQYCICTNIYRAYDKISNLYCKNECKNSTNCGINNNIALYYTYGSYKTKDSFTYMSERWYIQYTYPSSKFTTFTMKDNSLSIISTQSSLEKNKFSYLYIPVYNEEYYISINIFVPMNCMGGIYLCTNENDCNGYIIWDRTQSSFITVANKDKKYHIYTNSQSSLYLRLHYKDSILYGQWKYNLTLPWNYVSETGLYIDIDAERIALFGFQDSDSQQINQEIIIKEFEFYSNIDNDNVSHH